MVLVIFVLVFVLMAVIWKEKGGIKNSQPKLSLPSTTIAQPTDPLMISEMRQRQYSGSDMTIEETLSPAGSFNQYIASYRSDGLKIYGLLTVPRGNKPQAGWPVIIFNHGYIPPEVYRTTERYVAYVDALARAGYIVFKPDYRSNGSSEGEPEGAYYSPAYAVDVLNALASIKKLPEATPWQRMVSYVPLTLIIFYQIYKFQ